MEESTACPREPCPLACHAQILTRGSEHDDVDGTESRDLRLGDLGDVPKVRDIRVCVRELARGEGFDLGKGNCLPAKSLPRDSRGLDA